MNHWRQDRGFTLVEMLIALSIVGVVFALFSSVLVFGRGMVDRMAGNSERLDEIQLVKRLLTETLSQVVVTDKGGLLGENHRLSMVAYGPHALGLAIPVETTFEPRPGGSGLQARWLTSESGNTITHRIASDESTVDFAFFQSERGWVTRWEPTDPLPSLVRARLKHSSDGSLLELVVPVRRLVSPLCLTLPSGRCTVSR